MNGLFKQCLKVFPKLLGSICKMCKCYYPFGLSHEWVMYYRDTSTGQVIEIEFVTITTGERPNSPGSKTDVVSVSN